MVRKRGNYFGAEMTSFFPPSMCRSTWDKIFWPDHNYTVWYVSQANEADIYHLDPNVL